MLLLLFMQKTSLRNNLYITLNTLLLLHTEGAASNDMSLTSGRSAKEGIAATPSTRPQNPYFSQTTAVCAWLNTVVLRIRQKTQSQTWSGNRGT